MKRMSKSPPSESNIRSEEGNDDVYKRKDSKLQEGSDIISDDNVEEDALLSPETSSDKAEKTTNTSLYQACCEINMRTVLTTHVNVFLYATCFWIQIGVLPVSVSLLACSICPA